MAKLERQGQPAELLAVHERYAAASAARQATAAAWVSSRRPEELAAYQAAARDLGAARGDAVKMVERINGGARYNDTNYIFPSYIVSHLPRGLAGLVIAVIFAAAMSTLSGEFNSLATATMVDFYKRFVSPSGSDARELLISRVLTAVWGGFACLVALRAGQLGSAIEVVNRFGSYFYGSILGVFLLAVVTRRASARGAFYGLMIGMAAVFAASRYTAIHFLWYNVVGAVTVFVSGLAITVLFGGAPREQRP